jgi:branched-chain amino acid transport system ATP-binding protein
LVALDDVSIDAKKGEITLLIGPNGSGKTTMINTVSGSLKPDSGRVLFDGRDVTGLRPHEMYKLGLTRTFQIPAVFQSMTVCQNVMTAFRDQKGEGLLGAIRKTWAEQEERFFAEAMDILRLVSLEDSCYRLASTLSGGQMKLLELAKALASKPKMILMDEPIAGVLPSLSHDIFTHIVKLKEDLGLTFLVVEHRLDIALDYVDYVYAMHQGRVIASGSPKQVMEDGSVVEAYLGG